MRLVPLALAAAGESAAPDLAFTRTRMRDADLLAAAVEQLGGSAERLGSDVVAHLSGATITFRTADDALAAHFDRISDPGHARELIAEIDDEYVRVVQERAYLRLLDQAAREGMIVVDETVDQTNAIIVTLQVQA